MSGVPIGLPPGLPTRVFAGLQGGAAVSGDALAAEIGVSRAAVWQAVKRLRDLGLDISAVRGRGYRLNQPTDWLDAAAITDALPSSVSTRVQLDLRGTVDSTSDELWRQARFNAASGRVCLAERQTAGRGRRGRQWASPFGASLYLSMLWRFDCGPDRLSGLSLRVGAQVAGVLRTLGLPGVGLKWPNDLLVNRRKLGGILMELQGESGGPSVVVTGVGLNVALPSTAAALIDQPWTDMHAQPGGRGIGRNALAAALIEALTRDFIDIDRHGVGPVSVLWEDFDLTRDQQVTIHHGTERIEGVARGVDDDGALLVDTPRGRQRLLAGEVSLRLAP